MKRNLFFRLVTFYSLTTILFQSFLPFFYAVPHIVSAQEVTPTAMPTSEPTSTPTPEILVTPTAAPTSESTSTVIPTAEPTVLPTPTEIPSLTPTPTTIAPTPTSIPSIWTFEKVELNKEYVAPQNSEVKLTFTKLPNPSGNIKIEEITLSAEQIKQTGSLSDKAYDITSDMKDGEFTYNLSLPIPESSKGKEVDVKFAETVNELSQVTEVSAVTKESDRIVVARGLNHFTVFIITGTNPPSASNIIDDGDANFSKNGTWNNYAAGVNGDHKYTSNSAGKWARWTFADDQLPVAGQSYIISTSWVVWSDHVTNATYKLYDNSGVLVTTLATVNQKKKADGTSASNGTLSGWYTMPGVFTLQNGYYVELATDGSNTSNIVADAIKIETANTPSEVWVDKSWTAIAGTDLGSDKVKGYNSFETIQEAITAVAPNGTVYIATGTYTEIGQIIIDKNLSITGVDKNLVIIKPNQDTGVVNDSRGWILINSGVNFTLKNVTLDGAGKLINIGILSHGPGTIDNCVIKNISYNSSSPDYIGRGIAFYGANMTISNNLLQNYGRIGIYINGTNTALIEGNIIEGKGTGDHLDYAVEIEGGASAEIKNNDISNNKGVANDGSVSAGILATTYFAPGTNVKITNNSIHDNSYGVALGYNNDTTSVIGFNGNTFTSNTYDFDNYTVNNVDARNNTWSVTDQSSLDQIEGKINHYCSGSEYIHGLCDATYDYGAGFGIVRYKNIGTVTNSGWNIRSKSATPNETPIDLDCSATRYTNENSVAQNWTGVSGIGIKYQREVTYPSGSIGFFNAGSSLYTPFSTFGSGTGIEGQWKARVRAYVDQNNNNVVDSSEESSAWSSYCTVVFDKTAPTATVSYDITTLTNSDVVATLVPSEAVTVTNNSGATTYTFTANGSFTFNFSDAAGNTGTATATVSNIDKTAPIITINSYNTSWTNSNIIVNATSNEGTLNFSSHTFTANGSFDFIATDAAGNITTRTVTITNIDKQNPTVPVVTQPVANGYINSPTTQTFVWTASTDSGSGLAATSTYQYQIDNNSGFGSPEKDWSVTTTTWTLTNPLPDGTYYIRVRANDTAGNKSAWSTSVKFYIHTIAPTVSSVSSDGATYNLASASPTIKITFSEDIANTPTVEVHTVFTGETVTNCGDSDAKTFCFTYSLNDEEDTHTIYISGAQDAAGNTMSLNTSHTFIVDRIAPIFNEKTTFEGWYNTDQTSTFNYTGATTGNNPTCDITTEGSAQTCSITPNVCDAALNCNTTPITSNGADIDKTNPESTITAPSNSGSGSVIYSNSWTGSISGTATDDRSGVNSVKISIQKGTTQYFDGTDFVDSATEILLPTSLGETGWQYAGLTSPTEASYTIKSHAIDNATNMESTYTVTIIFDKTIPEVAISLNPTVGDAANGWYKTQPEVTLTATDTNFDKIEFQWDSQTGTWTTYVAPFKPGNEGAHVLYYRAHDKADNYSDVGVKNIKWNKTDLKDGPLNVSVSPNPTSESTSKVKWDAATSETIGIDKYEIQWKLKNGDKNYSASVGNGVREYTVDNLIEGVWEVKVTAFDASGNSKSASVDLTVDRSGPTAPTLSVFGTAPGSVSLSWSKVTDAVNYIIWYGTTPGSYQYGAKVGDTQSYTVQGLGGGTYYFIVKAVDASGNQGANSNEVSSGAIGGAAGVAPGTPAQGFAEEVLGANTLSPTPTPALTGAVLGTKTNGTKPWWWPWILLLILPPAFWFGYKKWKESKE